MASTNKTLNLELSQFIGTDKPSFLGDYNGDMSKIDTAVHLAQETADNATTLANTANTNASTALQTAQSAETTATTATSDASTALDTANTASTTATSASQTATEAKTIAEGLSNDVTLAQNTANSAQNAANSAQTTADTNTNNITNLSNLLTTLTNKFELTDIENVDFDDISLLQQNGIGGNLTLAQNSDGSLFKVYGVLQVKPSSYIQLQRPLIPGTTNNPIYGVPTGLFLNSDTQEVFTISSALEYLVLPTASVANGYILDAGITIGSDKQIYILASDAQSWDLYQNDNVFGHFAPCLYLNANFGDTPTPPQNA